MIHTYSVMLNEDRVPYLRLENSLEYSREKEFNSPDKIVDLVNTCFELEDQAEEHLITVAMDTKSHVLGIFHTSHGGLDYTEACPRNILYRALLCGAQIFAVCHNHPSGECMPSKADRAAAERIRNAGELIGIQMCDFIIIGKKKYLSFGEKEWL